VGYRWTHLQHLGDVTDRDDGQNFRVESTMEGLACVKFCRDADETEFVIGSKMIFSTAIQGESATQLMRQVVAPMAMVRHSCMRAMGECEGKRVLRLQNSISIAALRLPRQI
jgi:hypothetical protein